MPNVVTADRDMSDFIARVAIVYRFCNHVSQFAHRMEVPIAESNFYYRDWLWKTGLSKEMPVAFQYLALFAIYLEPGKACIANTELIKRAEEMEILPLRDAFALHLAVFFIL